MTTLDISNDMEHIIPLSKEQIQKLAPEEQQTIASLEAQRVQMRQELLRRARGSRSANIVTGLLAGLAMGLAILGTTYPRALTFALIVAASSVVVQLAAVNIRLDALMKLLDREINPPLRKDEKAD